MRILALESSCDESAVAVFDDAAGLLSHEIHSQVDLHRVYGGVVPELASRDHVRRLLPLLKTALADAKTVPGQIDGVAYTAGPGLIGALLTGAALGRSLAYAWNVPAIAVHHLEGHLLAPLLEPIRRRFRTWRCWSPAATPCSSTWPRPARTWCSAKRATTQPAKPSTSRPSC